MAVLLATIAAGVACAGIALWFSARSRANFVDAEIITTTVWRGPYDHALVTKGAIESASSTELKCEVRSRGGTTPILEVLPEGSVVKKGDVVVELDPSILREQENEQKIAISTRESLLATAENTHKAAVIAKKEYLEGLFVALENQYESELFLAERAKVTADAALASAKVLFEKAIGSALDVQVSYAALDDATNKLAVARTNLDTLRNLTKEKELTLLDAAISSAEADLKAQRRSLQLEQRRLKDIQKWIRNCTIRATAPGQVVYNNDPTYFRSSTYTPFVVEPGAGVRERQTVIWLPNPDDMQVRATVSEARVTLVQVGMPVTIRVEALDNELLEGEVVKVNPFAEPTYYSGGAINKYGVTIKIKNPPPELRVGMNAEARIHVEQLPSALQLPVQALAESNGRYYSLVRGEDDSYETREVELQSTNDDVAAISGGLTEGDEVVISPRSAGDLLQLPVEAEEPSLAVEDREREVREARTEIRQTGGE
jgi:HlyD family secretion protein